MLRFLACLLLLALVSMGNVRALAQDKSVKPGINDSFRDPNVSEFTERFEIESREVYALRDKIVEACGIKPGDTVADIGAGTGLFTRLFAHQVGDKGRVIAVDISSNFLDHIRDTSRRLDLKNIEPLLCKEDSTELPANSIDVAFICDTYHHFEYPYKTMASLRRAMKPGGRVIVIDFQRIEGTSSEWTLNHVRAGKEVFEAEIIASGFQKQSELKDLLSDNYFLTFISAPAPVLVTPVVQGYGAILPRPDAIEQPQAGVMVVFDATADAKIDAIHKGFDRIARLLNLYGASGLSAGDAKITIVMHGEATKSVLSNTAYAERFGGASNPNLPLIEKLQKLGVEVVVCGQALNYKGFSDTEVDSGIPIAASALTVLINKQTAGYAYIPMH